MSPHPTDLLSFARELVDSEMLPGLPYTVLRGGEPVDSSCVGWADREQPVPLRQDHIFRAFSNTKLVTSCAALLLLEQGKFQLDDPIKEWIPARGRMRALRPDAQAIDDTEPAQSDITVRQLLTHTAGFTTGVFGPDNESASPPCAAPPPLATSPAMQANLMRARSASASQGSQHRQTRNRRLAVE